LDDGEALAAVDAFLLRSNIDHLIDSSGQYRVNWAEGKGLRTFGHLQLGTEDNASYEWTMRSWDFPLLFRSIAFAFSLDIRVATMLTGDCLEGEVYADLNTITSPNLVISNGPNPGALYYNRLTTSTASANWAIDEQKVFNKNEVPSSVNRVFTTQEDGQARIAIVPMVRLTVGIRSTVFDEGAVASGSGAFVVGVQVREYP
jgi:hypothetical protein